jgi:hypothetical protein
MRGIAFIATGTVCLLSNKVATDEADLDGEKGGGDAFHSTAVSINRLSAILFSTTTGKTNQRQIT